MSPESNGKKTHAQAGDAGQNKPTVVADKSTKTADKSVKAAVESVKKAAAADVNAPKAVSKAVPKATPKTTPQAVPTGKMVAIVLVRGLINIRHDIKKTIDSLSLRRNNVCVVRKETAELKGMLAKAKDYITWGDIDSETYKLLLEKKGKKSSSADDKANGKGVKQYFNMNPPRKGYGRKGIKNSFNKGGALGYRGNKINDLIRRML